MLLAIGWTVPVDARGSSAAFARPGSCGIFYTLPASVVAFRMA